MMQFWSVVVSVAAEKLKGFWDWFSRLTSPQYVANWLAWKFREQISRLFDVKPRHSKDYYTFFRWMVSRRLVNAVVILGGMACLVYLFWLRSIGAGSDGIEISTYRYSAIPLRLAEGKVRIQAEKGYIAYEGDVSKGYVSGAGTLYGEDGQMVYEGQFDQNRFAGEGVLFGDNGVKRYEGGFANNLFEGNGTLYRESGILLYEGGFSQGMKEGEGSLYNASGSAVFQGQFHLDDIVYAQLLGRTAEDIGELYSGEKVVYRFGQADESAVWLREIETLCFAGDNEKSLSQSLKYDMVCVAKDVFGYGGKVIHTIEELTNLFGEPVYEGNSYATFPEAVAIAILQKQGKAMGIHADIDMTPVFDEVNTVNAYAADTVVYLHAYRIGEKTYTFVSEGKTGAFFLYEIE